MRYNTDERLFTVSEVAKFLKLSSLTIYKYIREQKLEVLDFGGHYRIPQASLDAFITQHVVIGKSKKGDV
jgi:excisionase family DNA binding protein